MPGMGLKQNSETGETEISVIKDLAVSYGERFDKHHRTWHAGDTEQVRHIR